MGLAATLFNTKISSKSGVELIATQDYRIKETGVSFLLILTFLLVKMNWLHVIAGEFIIGNIKCVTELWMYCERNVSEDG